jgi:hypothetical protein
MSGGMRGPVRRAQLIAPFGVGALTVLRDGTSVIVAGLDHWYKNADGRTDNVNPSEFEISEWRLQEALGVKALRQPPDFRRRRPYQSIPNTELTLPALRFPQYHFCPDCRVLTKIPLSASGTIECSRCKSEGKKRVLHQVPFVAMCEEGHIRDFPWREWVHETLESKCNGDLRLIGRGGTTLASQVVRCSCGKSRSLAGAIGSQLNIKGSHSKDKTSILCQGMRPWLGDIMGEGCGAALRGSLRSASNLYFAQVRSAIYLPRSVEMAPEKLIETLSQPHCRIILNFLEAPTATKVREVLPDEVIGYTDEQIEAAIRFLLSETPEQASEQGPTNEDPETRFRRAEYATLQTECDNEVLKITEANLGELDDVFRAYFEKLMLVTKLRETRALVGFTRVYPETNRSPEQLRKLLWRTPESSASWLPAYQVFGEGIFLKFREEPLREWESRGDVIDRISPLIQRHHQMLADRRARPRPLTARFVLLHTLAHLLINRLTYECGYGSSSLRERLYVSMDSTSPMAGILIYTAAGDSEGTMGGLVRMGEPRRFAPLVRNAISQAKWCSSDPVCMELGQLGGQGPGSCNLAACHNCALLPETACEEFNHFLDRALVVGTPENPRLGYLCL